MSIRKDIERMFGVLQGLLKILHHEMYEWSDGIINGVFVILYNMIVDMKRRGELDEEID